MHSSKHALQRIHELFTKIQFTKTAGCFFGVFIVLQLVK